MVIPAGFFSDPFAPRSTEFVSDNKSHFALCYSFLKVMEAMSIPMEVLEMAVKIWWLYGIPDSIVSDRGTAPTSAFWRSSYVQGVIFHIQPSD